MCSYRAGSDYTIRFHWFPVLCCWETTGEDQFNVANFNSLPSRLIPTACIWGLCRWKWTHFQTHCFSSLLSGSHQPLAYRHTVSIINHMALKDDVCANWYAESAKIAYQQWVQNEVLKTELWPFCILRLISFYCTKMAMGCSWECQALQCLQWNSLCMTDKDVAAILIFLPSSFSLGSQIGP